MRFGWLEKKISLCGQVIVYSCGEKLWKNNARRKMEISKGKISISNKKQSSSSLNNKLVSLCFIIDPRIYLKFTEEKKVDIVEK